MMTFPIKSIAKMAVLWTMLLVSPPAAAAESPSPSSVAHDLQIILFPDENRLIGKDRITLAPSFGNKVTANLSVKAQNLSVVSDGRPCKYDFNAGSLKISCDDSVTSRSLIVTIGYSVRYDDPVPRSPLNTENPGYGVAGSISSTGTFLLAEAGWYPEIKGKSICYRLRVQAPKGIIAVTAGKAEGIKTDHHATVSAWSIEHPVKGLALSAGPYMHRSLRVGKVDVQTYLFPHSNHLADRYLTAASAHLRRFEAMFGPYPFSKFAVVENFFPTGYGFSSYTLLGTRVLNLPFIPSTSLGHEIAHCWWGNSVFVDPQYGNWSEGLTTYVADYLAKEKTSLRAAAEHRLQMLRNFSRLVQPAEDFALSNFTHRYSPLSRSIGYDKSAMFFHMLRRYVGEDLFWQTLKEISIKRRFTSLSWDDIQQIFANKSAKPMDVFFKQWVYRKGAPFLELDRVSVQKKGGHWHVRGRILQSTPTYDLTIPIILESGSPPQRQVLEVNTSEKVTPFRFISDIAPRILRMDPNTHLFRRLHPSEMPPTVNHLKAAGEIVLVVSESLSPQADAVAADLIGSMGLHKTRTILESQLKLGDLNDTNVIFLGLPKRHEWHTRFLPDLTHFKQKLIISEKLSVNSGETFWGVFKHPFSKNRVIAVLAAPNATEGRSAARKITHYGKYSYLVFRNSQNLKKGTWSVTSSPVVFYFDNPVAS